MYSDVDYRKDITTEKFEYNDGYITIPNKLGLGIEINEEECLKRPYQPPYAEALYRCINRYQTCKDGILFLKKEGKIMERLIKIGKIQPVNSIEITESRMGLGMEKLDRDAFDPEKAYDRVAALGVKWI